MRKVTPRVRLIGGPRVYWDEVRAFLRDDVGGGAEVWADRVQASGAPDGEALVEFAGRECYRSWKEGLNPNVTRVREDSTQYLGNILSSGHGSVLEHANYTYILHNVSRVLTHEIVRHRAGAAYSQESLRFVRLTDIPFWFPEWAQEDEELMHHASFLLEQMEGFQTWMAQHFGLDATKECGQCSGRGVRPVPHFSETGRSEVNVICEGCKGSGEVAAVPFHEKKHKTSFMRRFAPEGVTTGIVTTFNIRTVRHIIAMRTALGAEEEIRLVCDRIAHLALKATPGLMQDYSINQHQEWVPNFLKV